MSKIYVLRDPRDNSIKYVGKTDQKLQHRLRSHLNDHKRYKSHKVNWIKQLTELNLIPIIELISEVPKDNWEYWEIYYIKYYRDLGCDLTNLTDGGKGYDLLWQLSSKAVSISLYQFDLNGNFIKEWPSSSNAAKILKINASHISECARLVIKSYKNYIWSYTKELDLSKHDWVRRKKILQLNLDGTFIKEWISIKSAANYYNTTPSAISRVLLNKRHKFRNYLWKYK